MKISACVITKNEEKNITRSILSYKGIVDEIIVVDSESTDDTVKIAESFGAKVYTRPWTNDFAAARNFAIDKASGDWIVFLDGDHFFGEGQDIIVKEMIEKAQREGRESICFPEYEICEGSEHILGSTYVDRIFKNDVSIRYANKIHECLYKPDGSDVDCMQTKEFVVYHTGYDPIFHEKWQRNLEILQSENSIQEKSRRYFCLAECYFGLGMYKECLEQLDCLFALPEFEKKLYTTQKTFRAFIFQIESMLKNKQQHSEYSIAQCVTSAVESFGKHPEIRLWEAMYYRSYHKIQRAIEAFEEALLMEKNYSAEYDNSFHADIANVNAVLSELYNTRNDMKNARRSAFDALCKEKNRDDILNCFFKLLHGLETPDKRAMIEKIFDIDDTTDLVKLVGGAWLSGNSDLFTVYLLLLLKKQPELATDHGILCRIYLLQKNYEGILDIANQHSEEDEYDSFALASRLAMSRIDGNKTEEDVLSAIKELMRVGEHAKVWEFIRGGLNERIERFSNAEYKEALAGVFEEFRQYRNSGELYLDVARMNEGEQQKGDQYLNAARAFYLAGDSQMATDILSEALSFTIPGNHLPIEILDWICQSAKEKDEAIYQETRRLKAKYEARYDLTYDEPLPFEQGVRK